MLTRRIFLAGVAASALGPGPAVADRLSLPLWPTTPPGGGGPTGPLAVSRRNTFSNISIPTIEVWSPPHPNGAAILVAAGGGYRRIALGAEAWPAARWLNDRNITAFVLSYRLPAEGWADGALAPLQDAQRALRLIRARAGQFGIDAKRLGVLGFSAGGHLMGMAATRLAFRSYEAIDDTDRLSARPDFAALIYPIITLRPPYDNTSTRRILIGDHPAPEATEQWSVETHVTGDCPPVFLVQARDDPISDPANTSIMAKACEKADVPVELHRLSKGGHGFGMGQADGPTGLWPGYFAKWLATVDG